MKAAKPGTYIFEHPRYRPLGDRCAAMQFGEETTVLANLKLIGVRKILEEHPIKGVTGVASAPVNLGVYYDPAGISYLRLCEELSERFRIAESMTEVETDLFVIPVWYGDKWTVECAAGAGVENNVELVARQNGLSAKEFVARFSETQFWVAAMFFYVGAYNALPLDPTRIFASPKYAVPRTYTPDRVVAYAGSYVGTYALPGPGGYQMLGRTPLNIVEFDKKSRIFQERDNEVLCRVTDRHIYKAIDEPEYHRIRQLVEAGQWEYEVTREIFSVVDYTTAVLREEAIVPERFMRPAK